ncbi:MAG: hypothetical protein ACLFRN_09155 [Halothece sp.]
MEGSPTQAHHRKVYGEDFSYFDFLPRFKEAIKRWNADDMAELFAKIGDSRVQRAILRSDSSFSLICHFCK